MLNPRGMYLFSIRSGVIDSDAGRGGRQFARASTGPVADEPYAEVSVEDAGTGFTAEEEAFFAEGEALEREDDDDLLLD
jgi:hypothetical protein